MTRKPKKQWEEKHAEILRRMAAGGYTNAEIQTHIRLRTGDTFSVFTISRYRAAASLRRSRPTGHTRVMRMWRPMSLAA